MTVDITRVLAHGMVLSVPVTALLLAALFVNPRMLIQDYPPEIQAAVPSKTESEKRQALRWGLPVLAVMFLVPLWSTWTLAPDAGFGARFLNAFLVASVFNAVDWLFLDWLVFCTLTPRFVVIPGTEGMAGYKNYVFHFRGFLIGTVVSASAALVIAGIVQLAR